MVDKKYLFKEPAKLWCSGCAKSGHLIHTCDHYKSSYIQASSEIFSFVDVYNSTVRKSTLSVSESLPRAPGPPVIPMIGNADQQMTTLVSNPYFRNIMGPPAPPPPLRTPLMQPPIIHNMPPLLLPQPFCAANMNMRTMPLPPLIPYPLTHGNNMTTNMTINRNPSYTNCLPPFNNTNNPAYNQQQLLSAVQAIHNTAAGNQLGAFMQLETTKTKTTNNTTVKNNDSKDKQIAEEQARIKHSHQIFINQSIDYIKKFLVSELRQLDEINPVALKKELRIQIKTEQIVNYRMYNMLLFGCFKLRKGTRHMRTIRGFLYMVQTNRKTKPYPQEHQLGLGRAYQYVFGPQKNSDVNYVSLLNS